VEKGVANRNIRLKSPLLFPGLNVSPHDTR